MKEVVLSIGSKSGEGFVLDWKDAKKVIKDGEYFVFDSCVLKELPADIVSIIKDKFFKLYVQTCSKS